MSKLSLIIAGFVMSKLSILIAGFVMYELKQQIIDICFPTSLVLIIHSQIVMSLARINGVETGRDTGQCFLNNVYNDFVANIQTLQAIKRY